MLSFNNIMKPPRIGSGRILRRFRSSNHVHYPTSFYISYVQILLQIQFISMSCINFVSLVSETLLSVYFGIYSQDFCQIIVFFINDSICFFLEILSVYSSVADLDPVGSGLFGSPGSGFFIHKKTPVILIFSLYKIVRMTVSLK